MNRLKFLVFALVVLGLWGYHLVRLSPAVSNRAAESSSGKAAAVAPLIAQSLSAEAAQKLIAASKAVQNPAVLQNLVPTKTFKPEPLSVEKFTVIRDAVLGGLPEDARANALIVVVTETASFVSKGNAAPATEGVEFAAVVKAGIEGNTQTAMEATYTFHSFPVTTLEKTDVKTLGTIAVGLPSKLPDVSVIQKELGLDSVALIEGGKVVASSGSEAASKAVGTLKPDESSVIERGSLGQLGPLPMMLPMFTNNDPMGGSAPLAVGSRRAISGTPFEVISVASVRPALEPLASYQKFAVPAFAALLLLTLVWLIIMGSGKSKEAGKSMVLPDRPELAATVKAPTAPMPTAAVPPSDTNGATSALSMPDLPPAPEASPDDFQFPNASANPSPPPVANPEQSAGFPFDGEDGPPTRAYPTLGGGADPFAAQGGPPPEPPPPEEEPEQEFNPEATRVAMIPTELLQQAQRQKEEPKTASMSSQARASVMAQARPNSQANANPDEAHWNDVFKDFVATRERCGEPADGLTYDKFKVKLQKNREQLVQKYNCRTVKFQVYVKEGKAALKATPVKD